MRIAPSQTPGSLLFLDELGNDAPRSLRPARVPGSPERRKARRFGDDEPLKSQVPVLKQDAEERQSERSQALLHAEGGDVDRDEGREESLAQPFHDGDEEPLLVAEVIVDIGLRAADGADDLVHADAVIATLEKQLGRRRADLFGLLVTPPSAADCSSRRVGQRRGGCDAHAAARRNRAAPISSRRSSTPASAKRNAASSMRRPSRTFSCTLPITIWGRRTGRAGIDTSVSFICCCARTPPVKAGEAVIVSTGLRISVERPWGREAQSSAFFKTPDMP